MGKKHTRSPEKQRERDKKQALKGKIIGIVLNYSWRDFNNGEIVYTRETEVAVREQLKAQVGYIPQWAVTDHYKDETNPRYGEVLNSKPI